MDGVGRYLEEYLLKMQPPLNADHTQFTLEKQCRQAIREAILNCPAEDWPIIKFHEYLYFNPPCDAWLRISCSKRMDITNKKLLNLVADRWVIAVPAPWSERYLLYTVPPKNERLFDNVPSAWQSRHLLTRRSRDRSERQK